VNFSLIVELILVKQTSNNVLKCYKVKHPHSLH